MAEKAANQRSVERDVSAAHADNLKDSAAAAYLYASMATVIGAGVEPAAYKAYRDQLLADCGDPHDPVEAMLIESISLAFHNAGRLFTKSASAEHHDVAAAYAAAATRLTAEFRRTTLTLQDYRARSSPSLNVVDEDEQQRNPQAAGRVA